jgi:SAM-dependent methyltransferase
MHNIYDEIFKHTDIFNPISLQTLHEAGKLADLNPQKQLIELGCGKGYPTLFWASTFGVQVEGVDISKASVDYANARAKLLNLSDKAQFFCKDLRTFTPDKKFDVVSSLGIESELYGGRANAFKLFKNMLKEGGVIIFAEPIWRRKPVAPHILKSLRCSNDSFLTMPDLKKLIRDSKLKQIGCFVGSKEDWELYVRAPILGLQEIIVNKKEHASEAPAMLEGFKTEHAAAGKHWDNVLWVLKPQ